MQNEDVLPIQTTWNYLDMELQGCSYKSRSEQAPGSEFHPRDKSEKNDCGFLGPSWCNKKVNPETYVPCGSYELLLSNVAHQMKQKLTLLNKFSHF